MTTANARKIVLAYIAEKREARLTNLLHLVRECANPLSVIDGLADDGIIVYHHPPYGECASYSLAKPSAEFMALAGAVAQAFKA